MIEVQIRVSIHNEFENSYTEYVEEGLPHEEIMAAARDFVEGRYGDHEAWDENEIFWSVYY